MPLTTLTMQPGRTGEQKQRILDGVHAALVHAFGIPGNDRYQFINEIPRENWDVSRSPNDILVEIKAFSGRSVEAKRELYRAVVRNLEACGVTAQEVFIIVNDLPMENWGIRGGQAACDIDFGFRIEV